MIWFNAPPPPPTLLDPSVVDRVSLVDSGQWQNTHSPLMPTLVPFRPTEDLFRPALSRLRPQRTSQVDIGHTQANKALSGQRQFPKAYSEPSQANEESFQTSIWSSQANRQSLWST